MSHSPRVRPITLGLLLTGTVYLLSVFDHSGRRDDFDLGIDRGYPIERGYPIASMLHDKVAAAGAVGILAVMFDVLVRKKSNNYQDVEIQDSTRLLPLTRHISITSCVDVSKLTRD